MVNLLNYIKKLKAAGIPTHQAEIQMEILSDVVATLASKEDLKNLEERLDFKIDNLNNKLDNKITILDNRISSVETILTTKINAVDNKISFLILLVTLSITVMTGLNILYSFFPNFHW